MSQTSYQNFFGRLSKRKRQEVEVVIKQMATARNKYKIIINEYYARRVQEGSLFATGRPSLKENFEEEAVI